MGLKIKNIITGWLKRFGVLVVTPAERKLSTARLRVCKACPFAKRSRTLRFLNGKGRYVNALMCAVCHCPCLEKSLVKAESCPLGQW